MKFLASTGSKIANSRLFYSAFLLIALVWLLYMIVAFQVIWNYDQADAVDIPAEPATDVAVDTTQAALFTIDADGSIQRQAL